MLVWNKRWKKNKRNFRKVKIIIDSLHNTLILCKLCGIMMVCEKVGEEKIWMRKQKRI